jgi:multidrug resistance efflux pump
MPEFDTDGPRRRTRLYGVLLAALVAVGALVLATVSQKPKHAVSSPGPAKASMVPQIADAKSEAEILFRGKSFAVLHRSVRLAYSGEIITVHVGEGQAVEIDEKLVTYRLSRESMRHIQAVLYPAEVIALKNSIYGQEISLQKIRNASLPIKQSQLERVTKEYQDARELEAKGLASSEAVKIKSQQVDVAKKEILELKDSMKQQEANLAKLKKDLDFHLGKRKRDLDLLEWQTQRSYGEDSKVPLDIAYLTAPIAGQVLWLNPELRARAELPAGFEAVRVSPMDSMLVRCKVHELDLVKLKTGDKGTVTFDAIPDKHYACKITRIPWVSRNPALEVPADYEIECLLQNPDAKIKVGMTCNVKVSVRQ